MRLPTNDEMTAFDSEEIATHSACRLSSKTCVHYEQLKQLDELFTKTEMYECLMSTCSSDNAFAVLLAQGELRYMAVFGLYLGLQLGQKISERDALERLCSDKS